MKNRRSFFRKAVGFGAGALAVSTVGAWDREVDVRVTGGTPGENAESGSKGLGVYPG